MIENDMLRPWDHGGDVGVMLLTFFVMMRKIIITIMVHLVGRFPHECHDFCMMHMVIKELI